MRKKQHAPNPEKLTVVLDIQIGALRPVDALAYGLPWLQYDNVHLALDPEFAYLAENNLPGERILLIHQFLYHDCR